MTIIPVFIHIKEKSDEEIMEEMARDAKMREAIRKDEEREAERRRQEKIEKERRNRAEAKRIDDEYFNNVRNNPWDYQFLPEGWSIFGQTNITPINEE